MECDFNESTYTKNNISILLNFSAHYELIGMSSIPIDYWMLDNVPDFNQNFLVFQLNLYSEISQFKSFFFDRNHRYYLFYVPTYFIYQTLFLTQQTKFCILPKINKFFQSQIVERYHHNFKGYMCFKFHNSKSFIFTRSLYI